MNEERKKMEKIDEKLRNECGKRTHEAEKVK